MTGDRHEERVTNNRKRYANAERHEDTWRRDDSSAAPIAPTASASPSHRCHSSDVVTSTDGDAASSQPVMAVTMPMAAPARIFATATVRQAWRCGDRHELGGGGGGHQHQGNREMDEQRMKFAEE